jgi:hypothetical protein
MLKRPRITLDSRPCVVFRTWKVTLCPKLADLLELTKQKFREKFRRGLVKRAKWRGDADRRGGAFGTNFPDGA